MIANFTGQVGTTVPRKAVQLDRLFNYPGVQLSRWASMQCIWGFAGSQKSRSI